MLIVRRGLVTEILHGSIDLLAESIVSLADGFDGSILIGDTLSRRVALLGRNCRPWVLNAGERLGLGGLGDRGHGGQAQDWTMTGQIGLFRLLMIPRTHDKFDADQQSSGLLLYSDCCSVYAGGSRNKKHQEDAVLDGVNAANLNA